MSEESVRQRIKKLLRHAEDRHGHPEAQAYLDKAFALMAEYGVEQAQLNDDDSSALVHKDIKLSGAYTDMQALLLTHIAKALHCFGVAQTAYRSSRIPVMTIGGVARHMERVEMLFALLNPIMLAGAQKEYRLQKGQTYYSATVVKRSWMTGFISTIYMRLSEAEASQSSGYDHNGTSGELVLLDDADKAYQLRDQLFGEVEHRTRKRQQDGHAAHAGANAGKNVDIGQTKVGQRKALTR